MPRRYTLSITEKYPIRFRITNSTSHERPMIIKYRVIDEYFEKTLKTGELPITEGFTVCGYGGQRASWWNAGWLNKQMWILYNNGSVDEMFDFRAEAGDRWIRDWDNGAVF